MATHNPSEDAPSDNIGVTPYYAEHHSARYRRQQAIRAIEEKTGRRLIVYYSDVDSINSFDVAPFEELCLDCEEGSDVDLLIQTNGGDADAAEKLVYLIRSRCSALRVIVVERAKSAGTMMALGADVILMGKTSELGPIDPQITVPLGQGRTIHRPAQSFLDGLKRIMDETNANPGASLNPVYYPMLSEIDAALIDYCHKSIERSKQFARKWLRKHMLRGNTKKAASIAEALTNVKRYSSHGIAIDAAEAVALGLKVQVLDRDDAHWRMLWELFLMYQVGGAERNKFFESRKVSLVF